LTAGSGREKEENDARWREAAALRVRFRGWVVAWLAPESCFRAYRRSSNARRVGGLTASSSAGMAELIEQADASPGRFGRREDPGRRRGLVVDDCPITPT
jgi:hypothetical protein